MLFLYLEVKSIILKGIDLRIIGSPPPLTWEKFGCLYKESPKIDWSEHPLWKVLDLPLRMICKVIKLVVTLRSFNVSVSELISVLRNLMLMAWS